MRFFHFSTLTTYQRLFLRKIALLLALSAASLHAVDASKISLDLANPTYHNGSLYTENGGVIEAERFRLQAERILYKKDENAHFIEATNEILLQYEGKTFTAEKLFFDLDTGAGWLEKSVSFFPPFYIDAEKLYFKEDRSIEALHVQLTTAELGNHSWQLKTGKLLIDPTGNLFAFSGVSARFFSIPLWLPSFHVNRKAFSSPLFRYSVTWDKGKGPRLSIRYAAYSWKQLGVFLRGEYRIGTGFGGAVETEYFPQKSPNFLITKSYIASDVIPTNLQKERRYRLQGKGKAVLKDHVVDLSWDKYSDPLMPGDFTSTDFAINTEKETKLRYQNTQPYWIIDALVYPKVNSFQSVYEQLPFLSINTHSFEKWGWIFQTQVEGGYEKFSYSDNLRTPLQDFSSGKASIKEEIIKAFRLPFFPKISGQTKGIFQATGYSNSPTKKPGFYGSVGYGFLLQSSGKKRFSTTTHLIQPYAELQGYFQPTSADARWIFSTKDGIQSLHEWTIGIKNFFYQKIAQNQIEYTLSTKGFFAYAKDAEPPWRIHSDLIIDYAQFLLRSTTAFSIRRKQIDHQMLSLQWTASQNAAFSMDFWYRSKWFFRKANRSHFFVENARTPKELLSSPLSKKRSALITKAFIRMTPLSSIEGELRCGFLERYIEGKFEAKTAIVSYCDMRLTYEHTEKDDRVTFGLEVQRG